MLVSSLLAASVLANYWAILLTEDSVDLFLSTQVVMVPNSFLPKVNLWLAYQAWYAHYSRTNGSPGPEIKSPHSFKTRASKYYEHSQLADVQRTARVMCSDSGALILGQPKPRIHCYDGLCLLPHDAYPTPDQSAQ